jgi:hypothetical protein
MSTAEFSYEDKPSSFSVEQLELDGGKGKQEHYNVGDVVMISGTNDARRIPIPSDNPNDPLNFSTWRKIGIVFTCCWFCECSIYQL